MQDNTAVLLFNTEPAGGQQIENSINFVQYSLKYDFFHKNCSNIYIANLDISKVLIKSKILNCIPL